MSHPLRPAAGAWSTLLAHACIGAAALAAVFGAASCLDAFRPTFHPFDAGDGGDGGSDADTDGDGDSDGDGDGGCLTNEDCPSPTSPRCDGGACLGCGESSDCAHLASTPACNLATGACVLCMGYDRSACPDHSPFCYEEEHRCVGCLIDDNCADPQASRCAPDRSDCLPCTADEQCDHIGYNRCDDGTCVACLSNADCESRDVCNRAHRECARACEPCASDADCWVLGDDIVCARGSTFSPGSQCMVAASSCERPWVRTALATDGGSGPVVDVCAPPPTTTCAAIVEFGRECTEADACGEDDVADDALCLEGVGTCSYGCVVDETPRDELCPPGTACSEALAACVSP